MKVSEKIELLKKKRAEEKKRQQELERQAEQQLMEDELAEEADEARNKAMAPISSEVPARLMANCLMIMDIILAFRSTKLRRDSPGFCATPAVTMTRSDSLETE